MGNFNNLIEAVRMLINMFPNSRIKTIVHKPTDEKILIEKARIPEEIEYKEEESHDD